MGVSFNKSIPWIGGNLKRLIASFSTVPSGGGEGGVGWAFVEAAAQLAVAKRFELICVVDTRDETALAERLKDEINSGFVEIVAISIACELAKKYGTAKTRVTYLDWAIRARRRIKDLSKSYHFLTMHQVTFATASMPSCLPPVSGTIRIWGPLAVPSSAVRQWRRKYPSLAEALGVKVARLMAYGTTRKFQKIIATNSYTRDYFANKGRISILEPNIFVELSKLVDVETEPGLISYCGLLIDRKRPWIAIEAMALPALSNARLQVLGGGHLEGELRKLAERLQVADRIEFTGALGHKETLAKLARSQVLVHPAAREGAAWVIGEAAALGIPTVAVAGSGCESTVWQSKVGGRIVGPVGDLASQIAAEIASLLRVSRSEKSERWDLARAPRLLTEWWELDDGTASI
ncbi:glycosyltransferase [Arthrobacter sp. AOP36-C1-22]|uniref:glycosyltransferase n=1 Tax=Arthrobacter sp. AOP36-C1-22 TaxID=3457683 RepID=UPI004033B642